jgi:hypothetical protein
VFTRAFASRTRASEPRKGPGYEVERKEQKAKSKKLKSKTQNAKKQKSEKSNNALTLRSIGPIVAEI